MPVTYFFTRLKTEEGTTVTLKPPCQTSGVKKKPSVTIFVGQVERGEKNAPGYVRIFKRGERVSTIFLLKTYFGKCIFLNIHFFEF